MILTAYVAVASSQLAAALAEVQHAGYSCSSRTVAAMPDSSEKPQFYQRPLPDSCVAFASERGQQITIDRDRSGDVYRGGNHVIGALSHVDMVVGMHWIFAADISAHQLDGAV